jgi:hypothetical protein
MLEKLAQPGTSSAAPGREYSCDQAEMLLGKELLRLNWTEAELAQRAKSDPEKIRLARKLRQETTVSLRWVAQRLQMGSWTHAANCLYRPEEAASRPPSVRKPKPARKTPAPTARSEDISAVEELPVHCL